jgi:hypothetical protein
MKNTTVAIVAIAAIAALLVASTAISTLTNQAFAGGHKGKSVHQIASQYCNNNANANGENEANVSCQNNLGQAAGSDISVTVPGNQAPIQGD